MKLNLLILAFVTIIGMFNNAFAIAVSFIVQLNKIIKNKIALIFVNWAKKFLWKFFVKTLKNWLLEIKKC